MESKTNWGVVAWLMAFGIGALVVVSLSRAAETPQWSAARARESTRFLHFNVCGGVCNEGAKGDVITALEKSIVDFRPVAVSLNEICEVQFASLRNVLRQSGYRMDGRWIETMSTSKYCAGNREGLALLSRRNIDSTRVWRLPRPRADVRTLLCIGIRIGEHIEVCGTHIAPHDRDKGGQIDAVADLTQFGPGTPVVLMGDFNATPERDFLDPIYARVHGGGAHGRFREVDDGEGHDEPCRCGEPTFERFLGDAKIDYIFLTAAHWRSIQGDAAPSPYSDHYYVRGSAVLRAGGVT